MAAQPQLGVLPQWRPRVGGRDSADPASAGTDLKALQSRIKGSWFVVVFIGPGSPSRSERIFTSTTVGGNHALDHLHYPPDLMDTGV